MYVVKKQDVSIIPTILVIAMMTVTTHATIVEYGSHHIALTMIAMATVMNTNVAENTSVLTKAIIHAIIAECP